MRRRLPSEEAALKILTEAGCSSKVVEHCKAVADLAVRISEACRKKGTEINIALVRIGALLHDVGRAKTHSVNHAIAGAQIALALNLPTAVVSIIERHVGGGIPKGEAEKLGWPVKSYVPRSLEERIVAYADKLIEGSRQVSIEMAVNRFRRDRHIAEGSVERLRQWHEELSACFK